MRLFRVLIKLLLVSRDMSANTRQQAGAVLQVSKSAENIFSITEANCTEANDMAASANELSAQAQRPTGPYGHV